MSASFCEIIPMVGFSRVFTRLALKHFIQLKYFLYFLFLTSAFRFHRGIKSARQKHHRLKCDKINIQRNSARQQKAMISDVVARKSELYTRFLVIFFESVVWQSGRANEENGNLVPRVLSLPTSRWLWLVTCLLDFCRFQRCD